MKYGYLCVIIAFGTSGCVSVVALDYVAPASGPTARVSVTSTAGEYLRNMPVLVHTEKCDYESSRLAGLLYSAAIGVDYAKEITFTVPANQQTSLSVQAIFKDSATIVPIPIGGLIMVYGATKTTYCRPVVDFFAKEGVSYRVELKADQEKCFYEVQSNETSSWTQNSEAAIREQCVLPYSRFPKPQR